MLLSIFLAVCDVCVNKLSESIYKKLKKLALINTFLIIQFSTN